MGLEMVLDAEAEVEAEVVAERKLAPELFVTLMRRHAGLAPDMGEMSELHCGSSPARSRILSQV